MPSTLGTFTPVTHIPQAYTTGPVTAVRITNQSRHPLACVLGGQLFDIVPADADVSYTVANLSGYGGWVLLVPKLPVLQHERLAGRQVTVTTYGGGDTLPSGSISSQTEASYQPYLAEPEPVLDTLRGAIRFNVRMFGARGDAVTDDTAALQACLNAAGVVGGAEVFLPPGIYSISSSLTIASPGVTLTSSGHGNAYVATQASTIRPTASFAAAQLVLITAHGCTVSHLAFGFTNTTPGSNPACNGIQITGAAGTRLEDNYYQALNGYAVVSAATSGQGNYDTYLFQQWAYVCNAGFHLISTSGQSYGGLHFLRDCYSNFTQNGDGFLIEDIHDTMMSNCIAECTAGSGSALHLKGQAESVHCSNFILGTFPGPSTGPSVLIEASGGRIPGYSNFEAGIVEGGSSGINITAGQYMNFSNIIIYFNGTGIFVGNTNNPHDLTFKGLTFTQNGNPTGTGNFDFQASTTGAWTLAACIFTTPFGTGANQTSHAIQNANNTTTSLVTGCTFDGSGYNSSNIFGGTAVAVATHCPGYNPFGQATAPAFPATTVAAQNTTGVDVVAYIANGTSAITVIQIAGSSGSFVTTGLQIAASSWGSVRIPARGQVKFTYGGGTPTWTWFGD